MLSAYISCFHNNYAIPRGPPRGASVELHKIGEIENTSSTVVFGKRFNSGRKEVTLKLSTFRAKIEEG
jgi:hypothetical protein